MFETLYTALSRISSVFILTTGIALTLKSRFRPLIRCPANLIKSFRHHQSDTNCTMSPFRAFATSLAGTVGVGNIVGTATALQTGGAGALLWMWIAAFFCMTVKYFEIVLALKQPRPRTPYTDAPMRYLGKLATPFAICAVLVSFCMGNMAQSSAIRQAADFAWHLPPWFTGLCVAGILCIFVTGGIRRIGPWLERTVPILGILFAAAGLFVIFRNIQMIPATFTEIFRSACSLQSVGGGTLGWFLAMRCGVSSGVFSNEAGLGSGGLAHGTVHTTSPEQQGAWGIFEVFADTVVLSGITGLAMLTSRTLTVHEAFHTVFGNIGDSVYAICILCFAVASMLSWSYYGECCAFHLWGSSWIPWYRILFLLCSFLGCVLESDRIWRGAEVTNAIMLLIHLTGFLCALAKETKTLQK